MKRYILSSVDFEDISEQMLTTTVQATEEQFGPEPIQMVERETNGRLLTGICCDRDPDRLGRLTAVVHRPKDRDSIVRFFSDPEFVRVFDELSSEHKRMFVDCCTKYDVGYLIFRTPRFYFRQSDGGGKPKWKIWVQALQWAKVDQTEQDRWAEQFRRIGYELTIGSGEVGKP